ncbi:MAG: exodeoxyribonuclease III [Treponema sp.]|nr:MAG: exodeoxyribonuclease III [Treponema sp.]
MKSIISWNVNGIRAAERKGFLDWVNFETPDVLCLQETKARREQVSVELDELSANGKKYFGFWSSAKKPGYSGTAIYSLNQPLEFRTLGLSEFDSEGRVVIAHYDKVSIISAYFPNSQSEGKRLGYKLDFCEAILEFCDDLQVQGQNVILCGDYNIAHKPIDLANPKANEKNPGYLPEERSWMDKFTSSGYTDTFRHFCIEPEMYTWWSYRFQARAKNIGWRLDYHCVNDDFVKNIKGSQILSGVQGSDHCPVKLNCDF